MGIASKAKIVNKLYSIIAITTGRSGEFESYL